MKDGKKKPRALGKKIKEQNIPARKPGAVGPGREEGDVLGESKPEDETAPHCPPSRSREGPCRSVVSLNASLGKRHLLQQQSPRTLLYGHPSTPQAQQLRLVALALERMEPAAVPVGYAQDSGSSWVAGALACKNRQ